MWAAIGWGDDEFLDAAHVAHLPIAFRAVGMSIVAAHAGGCHDDRSRQAHAAVENRAGNAVHARMRIFPQLLERLSLEGVERVRRPVFEGIIREKPELRIAVVAVDQVAQLERERGRDRNGAGDVRVVGQHLRPSAVGKDAPDHVAGVVVSYRVDGRR